MCYLENDKLNILITGIGDDIGANVAKILKEQNYFCSYLVGTDIKHFAWGQFFVDKFFVVPRANSLEYRDRIKEIIEKYKIHCIIPCSVAEISFFSKNVSFFEEKYKINIIINKAHIIETFLDKYKTFKFLTKLKIPTPQTFLLVKIDKKQLESFTYPVIVKPIYGSGSRQIFKISSPEELFYFTLWQKNNLSNFIVQEYLDSDEEYTSCLYQTKYRRKFIAFRRTLDSGRTSYAEILQLPELENIAYILGEVINLEGSINIQARKYHNTFYIFEINPRLSSTVYIRHKLGFEDVLWWLSDFTGFFRIKSRKLLYGTSAILGYNYFFISNKSSWLDKTS